MRMSRRGVPLPVGWVMALLLLFGVAVLSACGGASYAKAAHEPGSTQGGYGGLATAADAPAAEEPMAADEDYGGEAKEAMGMEAELAPAPPPPPPPEPVQLKTAQNGQPGPAAGDPHGAKPQDPSIASDAVPIQQILIYTAQISMAVFEVSKALNEVEALARSLGGFLSRRTDNEITIRVPAAQFDDALAGIAKKGDVLTRNVQVEDVTEEFLDVSLRLKNARQVRERIAQLLANAKNVEESLQVERELNRLSEEIERLEGRLKYLRDRARYSTITVSFQPVRVDDVSDRAFQLPFPWLRELGLGRLMNLR